MPRTLADLPNLEIYFHRYLGDRLWNPGSNSFVGELDYRRSDLDSPGIAGCAQLDDSFSAAINGVPIDILDRGHWPHFADQSCFLPSLGLFTIPDELKVDHATLVIQDASRSITADLGDALLPRTATPVGAADWSFHSGQAVELQWSPVADLATTYATVTFLGPTDPPHDHIEFQLGNDDIVRGGDHVDFTLPDRVLDGTLFIELDIGVPEIPCGDVKCNLSAGQRVFHAATLTP